MKKKILILILITVFLVGCSKVSYQHRKYISDNGYSISMEVPRHWMVKEDEADVDTTEYDNSIYMSHEKSSANMSASMTEIIDSRSYEVKYFKKQAKEMKKQNKTTTEVQTRKVGLYTFYYYKYTDNNFENIDGILFLDNNECVQISGYANLDDNIKSDDIRKYVFDLISSIIIEEKENN